MGGDRRTNILAAATNIFSKYGFHGAKMEDIAREAKIGKGTIYGYFDSKESLFCEMIKYGVEEYEQGLIRALKVDGDFGDKLYRMCEFHGGYIKKYIGLTQVIIMEREIFSKELMKEIIGENDKLFNIVKNAVISAQTAGDLRESLDPKLATMIISGSINQFYGQKIFYEKKAVEEIDSRDLIDHILQGLV